MEFETLANYAAKIIIAAIAMLVTYYLIPWLKDKRLYSIVSQLVKGAEKYATSHEIDKKQFVCDMLAQYGIKVTPVVEAFIEGAVEELDIELGKHHENNTQE